MVIGRDNVGSRASWGKRVSIATAGRQVTEAAWMQNVLSVVTAAFDQQLVQSSFHTLPHYQAMLVHQT